MITNNEKKAAAKAANRTKVMGYDPTPTPAILKQEKQRRQIT